MIERPSKEAKEKLACILIGYALNRDAGADKEIHGALEFNDLPFEYAEMLDAIVKADGGHVRTFFGNLGVKIENGKTAVQSVCSTLRRESRRERLNRMAMKISSSFKILGEEESIKNVEEAMGVLEQALAELKDD